MLDRKGHYNIRYPQCSGQTTNIVTLKSVDSTNKYSEAPGHCRDNSHRSQNLSRRRGLRTESNIAMNNNMKCDV